MKAIDIECPVVRCKAKIGDICLQTPDSYSNPDSRFHLARTQAVNKRTREENLKRRKAAEHSH